MGILVGVIALTIHLIWPSPSQQCQLLPLILTWIGSIVTVGVMGLNLICIADGCYVQSSGEDASQSLMDEGDIMTDGAEGTTQTLTDYQDPLARRRCCALQRL